MQNKYRESAIFFAIFFALSLATVAFILVQHITNP
jgi:hypothetical protein